MTPRTSRSYNQDFEKAINFLVFRMHESGHNPKPVILHSIRIATHLDDLGYRKEIVIAALLHDLVEDSDTSIQEIKKEFGDRVAELVAAMTVDQKLAQKERFRDNLKRLMHEGRDALVIATADFLDNVPYYQRADSPEQIQWLYEKRQKFIDVTEPVLKDEQIWKELKKL